MARTLRETLQKQLEQPAAAPQLGQTQEAQRLLSAKSGKAAGPSSGPARSAQKEQMAAQQSRLASLQQQAKGGLVGQDIQQQEELQQAGQQEQLKNIDVQRQELQNRFDLQSSQILDDLERGKKELSGREYQSKLEQVGFMTRLANQRYVQELRQEAAKNRLTDELAFKEALADTIWQDEKALFKDDIAFKNLMKMDKRQFNEMMGVMDANHALDIAEKEVSAFKQQQMWSGIAGTGSGVVSAYESGAFGGSSGTNVPGVSGRDVSNFQSTGKVSKGSTSSLKGLGKPMPGGFGSA